MAERYDFQIDSLKFRLATSTKYPYVRATAPFRKEQFDSSAKPGDQSLTGWWTRGQYSFHRGGGIKYYEVLDGDEVIDRFKESHNLEVWEPGAVRLAGVARDHVNSDFDTPGTTGLARIKRADFSRGDAVFMANDLAYQNMDQVTPTTVGDVDAVGVTNYSAWGTALGLLSVDNKIESWTLGATAPISSTVLWTNNDAPSESFQDLFWGKSRIWAVTSGGRWYALPVGGGTIALGGPEMFWDGDGRTIDSNWSFADTPGAIYLAREQFVYRVTVSDDGATIGTPTVVADLGPGAEITAIGYCRGRLGILTTEGFQVADISADGSLTVGPRFIECFGECQSIAVSGDSLYFIGVHPDDANSDGNGPGSVFEVNVSSDVATLQPAWTVRVRGLYATESNGQTWCLSSQSPAWYDYVAINTYDPVGYYGWNKDVGGGTYSPSGYLTTGGHRFGTLDLKQFYSLRVTVELDARAVANNDPSQGVRVYAVEADGTETELGFAGNGQTDFDLSAFDPCESLAFKFQLEDGAYNFAKYSPTLLGYQVKALPVPQRQRIIRAPLQLVDQTTLRNGAEVGREGKGYEDLVALETLEKSQAIVTFTDHRTGETGSAYVDSVEFQSESPSTHNDSGFGGIAYVTLRVLE